ncbi:hypothetical protein FO519_008785 [Halicephalobus sp. NKZ332]|nr:hypothetical protein FO519_008785 [Halicephalobus sp. NKZ332]
MSVVAAYMINSHGIHLQRYKGEKYNRWIPDEELKRSTPDAKFTPEDSRDRAIDAFELLRTKVDVIVIVNANLHYQETVQLVAEAARDYSNSVLIITIPTGSPLPLTVSGIDRNYSLYYLPEIIQVHKKMVIERRLFMKKKFSFESCGKTIFHIDAHGFLSFGDPPEVSKSVLLTLTNEYVEIEVVQNGFRRVLKDINNQERTPMFFSNVRNRVSVGEFARKNLENYRKSVVYDIFKYITKPLDEVEVDPDWSFSLVQNPEANILPCFLQVDTVWGTRIVSPELILKCIISAVVKCHSHKIENSKIDFKYPGNLDLDKVISEAIEHSGKKVGSRCM